MEHIQDGPSGKTCPEPCPLREATTSGSSSKASSKSKIPKQLFLCRMQEGGQNARLAPRTPPYRRGVPNAPQSGVMGDMESGCRRARSGGAPPHWVIITPSPGESSTPRRVGESHKDGGVYLLSSILMDNVPERFSLSPKACQGILRRAAKRGKELPEVLKLALERQAGKDEA